MTTRNHPLDGIERQKLTIRDVRVLPLSYVDPDGNLWRSGSYQVWKTDGAITQILTEEGLVGIGEGTPYENPADIKRYTEETIRPLLLGKNPFDVEYLTNRGNDSRHSRAPWAGIDAACWDLIGKATGKPVYELLCTKGAPQRQIKAIPNREYCELNQTRNPLKEGIFKEPLTVERGTMTLPDRPGFGVELIDDVEKLFPYVPGFYSVSNPRIAGT